MYIAVNSSENQQKICLCFNREVKNSFGDFFNWVSRANIVVAEDF